MWLNEKKMKRNKNKKDRNETHEVNWEGGKGKQR